MDRSGSEHEGRRRSSDRGRGRPTEPYERYGVKLNIVQKAVPVVELATDSIFHPNASWLLQAAADSSGKADGLYEYYQDRAVASACSRELRLAKDEMSICRLKSRPEFLVVGTNGKRSVMFGLAVLLALRDKKAAHNLERDIKETDDSLSEPLADVLQGAYERCEDEGIARNARGEVEDDNWSGGAGKRKAYEGCEASSPSRSRRVRVADAAKADSRSPSRHRRVVPDTDSYQGGNWSKNGGSSKDWSDWGWQDWSSSGWSYDNSYSSKSYSSKSYDYDSYGYNNDSYGSNNSKPSRPGSFYEGHGVKLNIVNNNVPVVELAAHSIFHGNASWLLQAVTGSCAKADGLYEYYQDKQVASICVKELNISRDEISICRLKSRPDVIAVGTNGKRSVMFALCIMLALLDTKAANALERDIRDTDASLSEPLAEVLTAAYDRSQDSRITNNAYGRGSGGGSSWNGGAADFKNYKAAYREASPTPPQPRRPRGGRGRRAQARSPRQVVPDIDDLNQQLEAFMAPDPARGRD